MRLGNKLANILFDLSSTQPNSGNDFHGGGEYAKTVFYRLCELLPTDTSLEIFYNPRKNIENPLLEVCKAKGFKINLCKNITDINNLLGEKKYDVFYSALPYSYGNLVIPLETRFIYTVHGLRGLEYPIDKYELKYKKKNLKAKIKHNLILLFPSLWKTYKSITKRRNKRIENLFSLTENQDIITVSEHSKFSIIYFFPQVNGSQIKVLFSPFKKNDFCDLQNSEILNSFSLKSNKYILLICGDRSEKGAYRACMVLNDLIKNHCGIPDDIKVLVLGVSYYKTYRKLTNNSSRFEFRGYVSAEDLEILYKNAFLFLYPTLNEGFGYPPLEAMKYGTICACSANSAITEVYGDSVLYFNPHDEIEMSIRILQSFDENIRREKHEKLSVRYQIVRKKQDQDLDLLIQNIIHNKFD
jgi:hypothetical protein